MDTLTAILTGLWAFMISPIGVTLVGGMLAAGLTMLYKAKPGWKKYEGAIVSAIKYAEAEISAGDDDDDTGAARLKEALRYVLNVYEARNGAAAKPKLVNELEDAIRLTHAALERAGQAGTVGWPPMTAIRTPREDAA